MYGSKWARRIAAVLTLIFVVAFLLVVMTVFANKGLFGPAAREVINTQIENLIDVYVTDSYFSRTMLAIGSAALAFAGAAFTMLLNWHYNEVQLPKRIQEFLKRDWETETPVLEGALAYARSSGLDPADTGLSATASSWSRFMRLFVRDTIKEQTQALAQSLDETRIEYEAYSTAYAFGKEKLLATHLVRGLTHVANKRDEDALAEFREGILVAPYDHRPLSAAAGCLRRLSRDDDEIAVLASLFEAGMAGNSMLLQAQALRRQAEAHRNRRHPAELNEARRLVSKARLLLGDRLATDDAKTLELGRCLTLFCEIQIERDRAGSIKPAVNEAVFIMQEVADHFAADETGGEKYGRKRAAAMYRAFSGLDDADHPETETSGVGD